MLRKLKLLELTLGTAIVIQLLIKLYSMIAPEANIAAVTVTAWSAAALIMGMHMYHTTKKVKEMIFGIGMWIICAFPFGTLLSVLYFGRCYYRLEQIKKNNTNNIE